MSRAVWLMAAIPLAGACGVQNWSFDHDAGVEDANVAVADADANRPFSEGDAALESGSPAPTGTAPETGPPAEAAARCSANRDCPADAPVCSPAGLCFRCSADVDCAGDAGTPTCDTSIGACVECVSNANCSSSATLLYCDTAADRCVQCLSNAECGFESLCQLASHTCTKMF